jgi:hypothetical protein
MHLWFVDDSRQRTPTRLGMGPLSAVGGIRVSEQQVKGLEADLEALCRTSGFALDEEFKWSPGRELWMHSNLRDDARTNFFNQALQIALNHQVLGIFSMADGSFRTAIPDSPNTETDVVRMLLERIHNETPAGELALVIADRPGGGGVPTADRFCANCIETIRAGTNVLRNLQQICLVLTCGSGLVRCLQLADVFTSCLCAYVSGEDRYSPHVVTSILPMLRRSMGRIGGAGVKIHPDYRYANLYHWLFQDADFVRGNSGTPFPLRGRPYSQHPDVV